jgi:hypothetical protein
MSVAKSNVFWGEIAPCDHFLQIYESENVLLDTLAGFVGGGLQSGESAVVIATEAHLRDLGARLEQTEIDLGDLRSRDQYLPLLAEETLERFMVRGWPDEDRFAGVVADILVRARGDGRRVRAFGEMVALLWAQGNIAATVRLEFLWQKLCQAEGFSLFCAYPKAGFTRDLSDSITEICAAHSRVVAA